MSTYPIARLSVLLGLAVVAAGAALYFASTGVRNFFHSSHASVATVKTLSTKAVSAAQLASTGRKLNQPIYWVGASNTATTYELTQNSKHQVFVRYLPLGVKVGSSNSYLAIGTYPMKNAFAVTRALAAKAGSVRLTAPGPSIALYLRSRPQNIYVAFPGSSYQIEIFDPSASHARQIIRSGLITDASAKTVSGTRAITAPALASYSKQLGQPIYWLGPKKNTTYELSRTANGRIYVRYLPTGTALGTRTPFLTVGTYPMANAYAVTRKLGAGSAKLAAPASSVAFSFKQKPTSVYLAFAGVNYQVELYDPTATAAHPIAVAAKVKNAGD